MTLSLIILYSEKISIYLAQTNTLKNLSAEKFLLSIFQIEKYKIF